MTHEIDHIWCGGVGDIVRWAKLVDGDREIPIPVYSRAFVNIVLVADGMKHKDVEKASDLVANFRHKFYKLVAQPGESVHYQTPHPPSE